MNFETTSVELLIDKMFNGCKHFSICDLDKLGEMIGVNPKSHPNYKFLQGLHCIDYEKMPPQFIEQLQRKVAECLRRNNHMDAKLMASNLMAEGNDFAYTEDNTLIEHKH